MASTQVGSVPPKLSFAKVLSMPPPVGAKPTRITSNPLQEFVHPPENAFERKAPRDISLRSPTLPLPAANAVVTQVDGADDVQGLTGAIEGLALVRDAERAQDASNARLGTDSTEDDRSHFSTSSSKLQNFDTKSMASVTTFAMDEKESIRPDDSASVRAADEEESVSVSVPNSTTQYTAEQAVAARAGVRQGANTTSIAARRYPTITMTNPPRFGDLPVSHPVMDIDEPRSTRRLPAQSSDNCPAAQQFPTLIVTPDDKVLEALATPKDRLPLLQLEERIIAFLSQPMDNILDLPPQNSFTRLLTHKVADYYGLQHHATEDGDSVRIYKSVCRILPTPLSVYAQNIPIGPHPPPGSSAFKIMRRTGLDHRQPSAGVSTAASSSGPSKATSENGGEHSDEGLLSPFEGTPSRDKLKLTREEREANYKAARERIFGDFQETIACENGSTGENSASMSRSSSASGKRKQRRQKAPKDDSFEARSSFVPGYPGLTTAGIPSQYLSSFTEPSYSDQYLDEAMAFGQSTNFGTTPTQTYQGLTAHLPYSSTANFTSHNQQHYGSNESWPSPQVSQSTGLYSYGNGVQSASTFSQHLSPLQGQAHPYVSQHQAGMQQPSQSWTAPQFQTPYTQTPPMAPSPQPPSWPNYVTSPAMPAAPPYQYGQLPAQHYSNHTAYSNQHPVPGSYNGRSLFNPQTRSFVPSNSSSRSGGRSSRKKATGTPGLTRNGSVSSSLNSDTTTSNGLSLRGAGLSSNIPATRPKEDSLQRRYGAPAHLPKKPPPSQVPPLFDVNVAALQPPHNGQVMGIMGGPPLVVNGSGLGAVP